MDDLVLSASKWPEILKGIRSILSVISTELIIRISDVDAVIHIASPVYHPSTTSEEIYDVRIRARHV